MDPESHEKVFISKPVGDGCCACKAGGATAMPYFDWPKIVDLASKDAEVAEKVVLAGNNWAVDHELRTGEEVQDGVTHSEEIEALWDGYTEAGFKKAQHDVHPADAGLVSDVIMHPLTKEQTEVWWRPRNPEFCLRIKQSNALHLYQDLAPSILYPAQAADTFAHHDATRSANYRLNVLYSQVGRVPTATDVNANITSAFRQRGLSAAGGKPPVPLFTGGDKDGRGASSSGAVAAPPSARPMHQLYRQGQPLAVAATGVGSRLAGIVRSAPAVPDGPFKKAARRSVPEDMATAASKPAPFAPRSPVTPPARAPRSFPTLSADKGKQSSDQLPALTQANLVRSGFGAVSGGVRPSILPRSSGPGGTVTSDSSAVLLSSSRVNPADDDAASTVGSLGPKDAMKHLHKYERALARAPVNHALMGEPVKDVLTQLKKACTQATGEKSKFAPALNKRHSDITSASELSWERIFEIEIIAVEAHVAALKEDYPKLPGLAYLNIVFRHCATELTGPECTTISYDPLFRRLNTFKPNEPKAAYNIKDPQVFTDIFDDDDLAGLCCQQVRKFFELKVFMHFTASNDENLRGPWMQCVKRILEWIGNYPEAKQEGHSELLVRCRGLLYIFGSEPFEMNSSIKDTSSLPQTG